MSKNAELINYTKAYIIGPGVWYIFHMASIKGTRTDVERLISFIRKYFPCEECRTHFTEMTNSLRIERVPDGGIPKRVYDMHCMVNKRLNKESPSYDDMIDFFNGRTGSGTIDDNKPKFSTKSFLLNKFTDPKYIGPGIWWVLHATAEHNPTLFERLWNILIDNFPCKSCSEHLTYFSTRYPICSYGRSNYPIYVWNFHDEINIKLGKHSTDIDATITFFKKSESCKAGCTSEIKEGHGRYV